MWPRWCHTRTQRDLNGAERMQMSSFAGSTPARVLPQDWGTVAECGIARAEKPPPVWPGPQRYDPKFERLSTIRTSLTPKIAAAGRESAVVGKRKPSAAAKIPGPGYYDVKQMPSGREVRFYATMVGSYRGHGATKSPKNAPTNPTNRKISQVPRLNAAEAFKPRSNGRSPDSIPTVRQAPAELSVSLALPRTWSFPAPWPLIHHMLSPCPVALTPL